ncbi:MAG: hypothetical protein HOD92_09050 [Deltaproteobacteria bacterium]|jgi:hypothetical protein|nr:hypothetical protein [Deltaproteobacteria bacterium]
MFNYVPVKLIVPTDQSLDPELVKKSTFLSHGFPINRDHVIGAGDKNMSRNVNLDIWADISPLSGKYFFEIAVQLPFFLPRHKNKDEYEIKLQSGSYIVCNRFCEVILDGLKNRYYLSHYLSSFQLVRKLKLEINQILMTKTILIKRFEVTAQSASKAIECNFKEWINLLNLDIPKIINSIRYQMDDHSYEVPDCNDIGKFCPIYVLCEGTKKSTPLKFVSHIGANQIQSFANFESDLKEIEDFCNGVKLFDTAKHIINKADLLYKSGEFTMSCILACIACESALQKYIRLKLKNQGLSNSKEKEALNDLTFSQMLNFVSYFIFNMKSEDLKQNIGKLNSLRKLRNELIHKGKWISDDKNNIIKSGITAIKELQNLI